MPCTVPAAGRPNFTLADDEMEMGVGIHGEPGRRRVSLAPADAIADELVGAILKDLAPKPGSEMLLLVNGFGATPLIGLYLLVNSAKRILDGAGIAASRFLTGSYVTSLDMAGASVPRSLCPFSTARRRNCGMRRCTQQRCGGDADPISLPLISVIMAHDSDGRRRMPCSGRLRGDHHARLLKYFIGNV